jgi:hypothetical protein
MTAPELYQVIEIVELVPDRPMNLVHAYREYARAQTICGTNRRVVIPTGVPWSDALEGDGERCQSCVRAVDGDQ